MTLVADAPVREDAPPQPFPMWMRVGYVAAIAIGLVLWLVTVSDLWLDETLSVNIAVLPWSDLVDALKQDGSPPLYYALLHVWTDIFGTGDLAVRSLSAFMGVGFLVALWFTARRVMNERAAWLGVLVITTNPFVIRYASETRMYMLGMLLVTCGILAVLRALERPSIGRLATFAVLVGLLALTQYWCLYLLAVTFALLCLLAWRGTYAHAARRLIVAFVIGAATFLPWLPTFLYQREHTGTPWGTPVLPGIPVGVTFLDFSGSGLQEGWMLFLVIVPLLILGVFAFPTAGLRIELDLRGHPEIRWIALFGIVSLFAANAMNYVAGGAWQSRYSALFFPFFALVLARGFTIFRDQRMLAIVVAVVVGLGLVGGLRNFRTQRTSAARVAAVINDRGEPGDLVVYCPDQVGPSVNRLTDDGFVEVTYPRFLPPERVDWVDYVAVLRRADPLEFAEATLDRAGDRTVWFVSGPGYRTHRGTCEEISDALSKRRERVSIIASDTNIFEKPGLQQFPARRPSNSD